MKNSARILIIAAGVVWSGLTSANAEPLPALGADLAKTSVSGLSSGAYMAGQFQVAHSQTVTGAGIVAGGPYGCAQSAAAETFPFWAAALPYNTAQAINGCMANSLGLFGVLDAENLAERARSLAASGRIDPVAGLKEDRVYLYTGENDDTVEEAVVETARDFYLTVGVLPSNIVFHRDKLGGHGFLTEDAGTTCGASRQPYLNDCDYDQAGAILQHIYGPLQPPATPEASGFLNFEQSDYAQNASMAEQGYAYIPASCRSQTGCAVHIVFHGCQQGAEAVGDIFVKQAGFAEWAETNRIVLLFPQIEASTVNPKGCWDWWGYTGLNFLTREAPQIEAVNAMLQRLASK